VVDSRPSVIGEQSGAVKPRIVSIYHRLDEPPMIEL